MIKKITLFAFVVGLLVSCSSAQNREEHSEKDLHNQKIVARIQSIDEKLSQAALSEEAKQKLKMDKAKILLDEGNYDEATVILKNVLQSSSQAANDPEVNLYLGKAYYGKSDFGTAINYLSNSERLDRSYSYHERKKLMARSLYEEEEYYPALAALGRAYRSPSVKKDVFFYETAAQTYYKMGYTNKSIMHFKKSLQLAEIGLKEFPNSTLLQRIQEDSIQALGPNKTP